MQKALAFFSAILFSFLIIELGSCSSKTANTTPTSIAAATTASTTMAPTTITSRLITPPTSNVTLLPTATYRVVRAIDLVAFQSNRDCAWFSASIDTLPTTLQKALTTFDIQSVAIPNRQAGQITPTLVAGYVFLQFGISPALFEQYSSTLDACFIRSALLSFVDYTNNRVLGWDRKAINIPMDISGIIRVCNQKQIPVFLEINYSDYVPGRVGTGVEALQRADNIAGTTAFLKSLQAKGLHIEGVTFGDEIGDDSGFGDLQPILSNSDLIGRFIAYAHALKTDFPELKIYAFDSYIAATRGQVSEYWPYFQRIRQSEIQDHQNLLDGFVFRESYTYMDEHGQILDSQRILDDTESLYRDAPVYRYDVNGTMPQNHDRDYLHQIINQTNAIFGRTIDIGLTEYLPAGPVQINESDTSRYSDMDFILHYADVVGIYAMLGLNFVSTWEFANSVDQAKCYVDKNGNQGANYPIHEQLAQYLAGDILNIDCSASYDLVKCKVYATRKDNQYFIMILNKDVASESTIRVTLPGLFDLTLRLPKRSYTTLVVNDNGITVSGVGS